MTKCSFSLILAIALIATLPVATSSAANDSYIESFGCDEGPFALRLPKSYQQLRKMGKLRKEETLETEDWDTYKAIRKSLDFGGLTMHVITFTNDPDRYMIGLVEVSSAQWSVTPFRIGEPIEAALRRLGVKSPAKGPVGDYGSESGTVHFDVSHGRLVKITYECYTG